LAKADAVARLWARDGTLWQRDPRAVAEIEQRLGWLDLPQTMPVETPRLKALAAEVSAAGIRHVALLGMGGSSLAPETMESILGRGDGCCDLVILDTTDPAQIRRTMAQRPVGETLFIVASKSGGTAESMALYHYFRAQVLELVGESWASHFVAITDPGTSLERLALDEGFRAVYLNPPDIGGRYSALSLFGLVPLALVGADLQLLLERARSMMAACDALRPLETNPGAMLGAMLGAWATGAVRRDKVTLISSPELTAFVPWVEQLVAESTGKHGLGILPLADEGAAPERLGNDRLYVYLRLADADNAASDARAEALLQSGQPLLAIALADRYDLGAEFYRWELATAMAGAILAINPFDQPDVESAKVQARTALAQYETTRALPAQESALECVHWDLFGPPPAATEDCAAYLTSFVQQASLGDYLALMAYIDRSPANERALNALRGILAERLGVAVTVGFGPRFLHSTGQLHKGGPNTGIFMQITQDEAQDLGIPGQGYTFGVLKTSQALGDMSALRAAGRRAARVHLKGEVADGLAQLLVWAQSIVS
jgi:glucose-6-phosphate isomerase